MRDSSPLPNHMKQSCESAKQLYRAGQYSEALTKDSEILREARRLKHKRAEILGLRFVGLCLYRLEELEESERTLSEAVRQADQAGEERLSLMIANHLGATLRRLGRLDEALKCLKDALARARTRELADLRAQLLGSLGALLDSLGQRARADDCYARYEELLQLQEQPRKLANARALAGRAHQFRGDYDEARWRFEEERQLGERSGERIRVIKGYYHLGKLDTVQGQYRDAERNLDVALERTSDLAERNHRQETLIHLARARLYRSQGRTIDAWAALEAASESTNGSHLEERPELLIERSAVCRDAGLHGEALWYLQGAVEHRYKIYSRQSATTRALARPQLEKLREQATALIREAVRVVRDQSEEARLQTLLKQVSVEGDDLQARWEELRNAPGKPLWEWQRDVQQEAQSRWDRLMGSAMGRLESASRRDLIRSDLTYHGAINDLGRSAHLLALVLERELGSRLWPAMHTTHQDGSDVPRALSQHLQRRSPPTLGTLLAITQKLTSGTHPFYTNLKQELGWSAEVVGALQATGREISVCSSSDSIKLVEVRNGIVHGKTQFAELSRLQVDAIRRRLILDSPAALQGLVKQ